MQVLQPTPSSDIHQAWDGLVAAAMLGTERRPVDTPILDGPLNGLLACLNRENPEANLLLVAGVIGLYSSAGSVPAHMQGSLPAPCEPEQLRRCSPQAGYRLSSILIGQYAEVLPEWLEALARSRQRPPDELLPALLDLGERRADLDTSLLAVLGRRGLWLADFNPTWEWARFAAIGASGDSAAIENVWDTGSSRNRLRLLEHLRRTDPAEARRLVDSTWEEDSARERAAFLGSFRNQLSMSDEPFLEAALDDRAESVRLAAADLLARLPESRLVQRMSARMLPLIHYEPGRWPLRKASLEITLPETCDDSMVRDGIGTKVPSGSGQRTHWFQSMLQRVPPSVWCQAWGRTPAELLDAAGRSQWKDLLQESWATATVRYQDALWAEALLGRFGERAGFLEILPPGRQEAHLRALFTSGSLAEGMAVAGEWQRPWSQSFSQTVLTHLRPFFRQMVSIGIEEAINGSVKIRTLLKTIGLYSDPALLDDVARQLTGRAEDNPAIEHAVRELLALLEFRRDMLQEIASDQPHQEIQR